MLLPVLLLMIFGAFPALGAAEANASGTVTVAVAGKGDVTGDGIDCDESGGPDCSQFYANVQECDPEIGCFFVPPDVDLTAGPDRNGYVFDSWTGCDAVDARVCWMTVTASRSVTASFRDAQAPSVSGVTPSGVRRGTIALAASASDNSGAVQRVEFRVRGTLVGSDTTAPYGVSFNTASVVDGLASVRATAFDAAGNSGFAESSITIDNTAPTLSITGGPADGAIFGPASTQTWTFSASDATSGLQSVQCSVVPEGTAPSFAACSGGASSHSVSDLAEGSYTFTVRATDNGGLQTSASRTFSIDATAPSLTVTGPDGGTFAGGSTLTWDVAATDGGSGIVSVECSVVPQGSSRDFGPCSDGSGGHSVGGLGDGDYELAVRATDGVGQQTTELRSFSIDATAPNTIITSGPKKRTTRKRARFAFRSTESGSSFKCRLDGGAYKPCTSPTVFRVGKGRHKLWVRATDAVGNVDPTPASYAWRVLRR